MQLDEYLFRTKQNNIDFAKKLGISRGHLQRILSGDRRPSVSLAKKIEELSKGKVSKEEMLFPEEFKREDEE